MSDDLHAWEQPLGIVLQQEVPVRLVNISRSGCLLHVSRALRVGMVGRLRIALDDAEYTDDVRIARCVSLTEATCEVGVELLWLSNVNEPRGSAPSLAWRLHVLGDGSTPARLWLTES
jgi:hypothetical protein